MIKLKPHLEKLYRSPEGVEGRSKMVRMDRNERVEPFPDQVFKDMLASVRPEDLCSYPDPSILQKRLSDFLGVAEASVGITNGSDAALKMIFHSLTRPGDRVAFLDPSYAMYSIYSKIFELEATLIEYTKENTIIEDSLWAALRSGVRLLILANPNQPTGTIITPEQMGRIAEEAASRGTVLVVDEAYYPFYSYTSIPLTSRWNNVLVMQSFSKAWGVAGLRLGCLMGNPKLVDEVRKVRGNHEVNAVAIRIGHYLLDHPELREAHLQEIEAGRAVLAEVARELGLGFPPCPGNFQLLRMNQPERIPHVVEALKQRGFLVKAPFNSTCISDCIRVTLCGPRVVSKFAVALRDVVRA